VSWPCSGEIQPCKRYPCCAREKLTSDRGGYTLPGRHGWPKVVMSLGWDLTTLCTRGRGARAHPNLWRVHFYAVRSGQVALRNLLSTLYPNKGRSYPYRGWCEYTHEWNYSEGFGGCRRAAGQAVMGFERHPRQTSKIYHEHLREPLRGAIMHHLMRSPPIMRA
jgi:hypothetical protein